MMGNDPGDYPNRLQQMLALYDRQMGGSGNRYASTGDGFSHRVRDDNALARRMQWAERMARQGGEYANGYGPDFFADDVPAPRQPQPRQESGIMNRLRALMMGGR